MNPVITIKEVSKAYRLGTGHAPAYRTLRETLVEAAAAPWRRLTQLYRSPTPAPRDHSQETLWALNGVSLDIQRGEIVGLIGRNGAGKSTLLKTMSRITEPTAGRIEIRGRIGSLLEVGTGFHPELTGRENIYLNGAILGMSRKEIRTRFDAIVSFAQIERFLDTPVKRYSSGMYVRLAFAVAAHLEPEILLVDEVLAVGDVAFQKKCLGRMAQVAHEGRTILFVSHNLAAIQALCTRVIWLKAGEVCADGRAAEVIAKYLSADSQAHTERCWDDVASAPGNDMVRIQSARILPPDHASSTDLTVETPFKIEFCYWNLQPGTRLNLSMVLYNHEGACVFATTTAHDPAWHGKPFPRGLFRSLCTIPGHLLNDGTYRVALLLVQDCARVIHQEENLLSFEIQDTIADRGGWYGKWIGAVRPKLDWSTELLEATRQG